MRPRHNEDLKKAKQEEMARVQINLISMVNDAKVTEREKRMQPDEMPDSGELIDQVDPEEGSISKPAGGGLQFRASPDA